jgi:hypothetical protein
MPKLEGAGVTARHLEGIDEEGFQDSGHGSAARAIGDIIEFVDSRHNSAPGRKWGQYGASNLQNTIAGFFSEIEQNAQTAYDAIPPSLHKPYTDLQTKRLRIDKTSECLKDVVLLGKLTPEDRALMQDMVTLQKLTNMPSGPGIQGR